MRILLAVSIALLGAGAAVAQTAPPAPRDVIKADQVQQFLRVAQRLSAQGDLRGAIGFYNQVLAVEPNNPDALSGVADVLVAAGQPLEATPFYQKLRTLKPADVRYQLGLARAYNRAERPQDALAVIEAALATGAQGGLPWTEKGLALDLMGRFKDAQLAYGQALKLSPKNPETLQRMAFSFACMEEYRTALNLLGEIANQPGGKEQVRNALATVYALSGQTDAAMQIAGAAPAPATPDATDRRPYYAALARLDQLSKARAVHLGILPPTALLDNASSKRPPAGDSLADTGKPYDAPAAAPLPPPAAPQMKAMPADPDEPPAEADAAAPTGVAASPTPRAAPMGAGDRAWVQLGVSPNRTVLDRKWRQLVARAPDGLTALAPYVQPVIIGGQSQLRLLVGGYADNSTAAALAKRLRSHNIQSFVNRNPQAADPLYP